MILICCGNGAERAKELTNQQPEPLRALAILAGYRALGVEIDPRARLVRDASGHRLRHAPASGRSARASHLELDVTLPILSAEPVRIERGRGMGVWLHVYALGSRNVLGESRGNAVVYDRAFEDTDVVQLVEPERVEELRLVHTSVERVRSSYRIELGPALPDLRLTGGTIEALDSRGVARLRAEPAFAVDARGVQRDLTARLTRDAGGFRLDYELDARGLVFPVAIDPTWTSTGALNVPRRSFQFAMLPGGNVLAIGGGTTGVNTLTETVEEYDIAARSWTLKQSMQEKRHYYASLVLSTGRVLVTGGGFGGSAARTGGELYNPSTNTWEAWTNLPAEFVYHSATEIDLGRVLLVGNHGAVIHDAGVFTDANPNFNRNRHAAVQLDGGKVMIIGGCFNPTGSVCSVANLQASAELFDPSAPSGSGWTLLSPMTVAREYVNALHFHGADGKEKVLVAGGIGGGGTTALKSAELYDVATNKWTQLNDMSIAHVTSPIVELPSGRVAVIGGFTEAAVTARTDVFDLTSSTWSSGGDMLEAREDFPGVRLSTGEILVAGGGTGGISKNAELLRESNQGTSCSSSGECQSGYCTDGFCCSKTSCSAGETCAGPAAAGECKKTNGQPCGGAAECASAHCTDGFCCDKACDGQCEACDAAAKRGTCSTVPSGDEPHGARAACTGTGVCRSSCGGTNRSECTLFPGSATQCSDPLCRDGTATLSAGCDGRGECAAAETVPCGAYACGTAGCKTRCASAADCAVGSSCDATSGECVVVTGVQCDGDHTLKTPGEPDQDCAPLRCAGAACLGSCSTTLDCISAFVCDTGSGRCVRSAGAAGAEDDSGCGCRAARAGHSKAGLLVALTALAFARGRRRARVLG